MSTLRLPGLYEMMHMDAPGHQHVPVMRDEVLEVLECRTGKRYVDGTLGGGGYAEAILEASAPEGSLLALDWDAEAITRARSKLVRFGSRLLLERASFTELPGILDRLRWAGVDGMVLDLGVSSYQLDDPERGFSFLHDGPLDMRMDQNLPHTAAELVNTLSEKELARIIFELGEERWARRIARSIVLSRETKPFTRTMELSETISSSVPRTRDSMRIHPATRTFQALRIAVNRELEQLDAFLDNALNFLNPGGRLCVVAFHSLEDRMVKVKMREWARSCRCPEKVVQCVCEGKPLVRLLTRKALRPGVEEVQRNPRSRSARLRAAEKA